MEGPLRSTNPITQENMRTQTSHSYLRLSPWLAGAGILLALISNPVAAQNATGADSNSSTSVLIPEDPTQTPPLRIEDGLVLVRCRVKPDGRVCDIEIVECCDRACARAVKKAVASWRFHSNGSTHGKTILIPVVFSADERSELKRAQPLHGLAYFAQKKKERGLR